MTNLSKKEMAEEIAMSPQQKRFHDEGKSKLALYKEMIVGDQSWLTLAGYELTQLLFGNTPTLLGYGARSVLLPMFLKSSGKGLMVGRGVNIRQPHRISIGKSVFIDDYATLDVRAFSDSGPEVGIEIQDKALVGRHSVILSRNGKVKLGAACNISSYCRIASETGIDIGESVLIAAYVYIGPGNHGHADPNVPIIEQAMDRRGGVKIGKNSWIGTRATILDGVTIGEGAIVGAHSLVKEDVPDRAIVAGTPAKIIRSR